MNPFLAAHHEAAHTVVSVVLGLPLQESGTHIDTIGGGIAFNFHRKSGDQDNALKDVIQRERAIVMIKAGYIANLKLFANSPAELAADDRREECSLLDEMYPRGGKDWAETDERLRKEAWRLVDERWNAIEALAYSLLDKPVTPRPPASFQEWASPDTHERWMNGNEVAALLGKFQLTAIVRKASDGVYHPPDL